MTDELTHVRVTHAAFPATFVIPLSETITITRCTAGRRHAHLLVQLLHQLRRAARQGDDAAQRLACVSLPDYAPLKGRHNHWGFDPEEQRTRTYLGMGEEDINLHDQWAVESMGAIQDRTGSTSAHRQGDHGQPAHLAEGDRDGACRRPPADGAGRRADGTLLTGPDTINYIAPATGWEAHGSQGAAAKRAGAAWLAAARYSRARRLEPSRR